METGSRRCFQTTRQLPHDVLRLLWWRCPTCSHHSPLHLLLGNWFLEPSPTWFPHERNSLLLRPHRDFGRIRQQPSLQSFQGTSVAVVHRCHGPFVPGSCVLHLLLLQHRPLLHALVRCGTFLGCYHRCGHVVRSFRPSGLCRCLLWLQARGYRVPNGHLDDCPCHSSALDPVEPYGGNACDRYRPLCSGIRRTVLHHVLFVDGPILLRLWIHFHCLYDLGHYLRRSHPSHGLQPALRRKSPLVVVLFLRTRIDRLVHLHLQYVLV
mmetsp:Transcript_16062/g.44418  ORF Transcript_16062/g.44418 Transcript_16062/m.44418 type:complete len:266 (-) Transcript_16062:2376-3173(-)